MHLVGTQSLSQRADRLHHQSTLDTSRHALAVCHTEGQCVDACYLCVIAACIDACTCEQVPAKHWSWDFTPWGRPDKLSAYRP